MSGTPTVEDATAYPKIPSPFIRDHVSNQLTTEWATPELAATADLPWRFTEKVDGTNIRVIWDGYRVTFAGRTSRAQLPAALWEWLQTKFGGPEREQLFEQKFGTTPAVLYGEGYGAGIQAGGKYRPDIAVVFYDALVDRRWWLLRGGLSDVCDYFGVDLVPEIMTGLSLTAVIAGLRVDGLRSRWGAFPAEGLVGTTSAGLRGRAGDRITVKLKTRDLSSEAAR